MTDPEPADGDAVDGDGDGPSSALERLLVVQHHDTETDQLRHRLSALPERARLEAKLAEIAQIEAQTATLAERRDAINRDLARLEAEVATVEARRAETDGKLYGGAVSAPRELHALQDELASLKRRQSSLEDDELELMEQAEPIDADLARLADQHAAADEEATTMTAALAEVEATIAADLERVQAERAEAVAGVDAALLGDYERLRHQRGGVAVARLEGSTCGGCHLILSAVEVDHIRRTPAGAMVHCEECGRILVH